MEGLEMEKGDKVYISKDAHRPNIRSGSWNDTGLSSEFVKMSAGTILYHSSIHEKLTAFVPCLTAFSVVPLPWLHIYRFTFKREYTFEKVDSYEYRINLATVKNDDVEIVYLGTAEIVEGIALVNEFGIVQNRLNKFCFSTEYKQLEVKLNTNLVKEFSDSKDHMTKIIMYSKEQHGKFDLSSPDVVEIDKYLLKEEENA
jgi:hypothetical protein